jgi:hypothetical protein
VNIGCDALMEKGYMLEGTGQKNSDRGVDTKQIEKKILRSDVESLTI